MEKDKMIMAIKRANEVAKDYQISKFGKTSLYSSANGHEEKDAESAISHARSLCAEALMLTEKSQLAEAKRLFYVIRGILWAFDVLSMDDMEGWMND